LFPMDLWIQGLVTHIHRIFKRSSNTFFKHLTFERTVVLLWIFGAFLQLTLS